MKIIFRRPELFTRSQYNIWLDQHVQTSMLKEHLDPFSDAASRKGESISHTVDFLRTQLLPGSNILDLGCGPGLYAGKLSDTGYSVTGIDINCISVDYARETRSDITYICGDYITDYPAGCYDAAIMIYCDFGALTESESDILLNKVYGSLNEGGVFIFDFFDTRIVGRRNEGNDWEYSPEGGFWSADAYLLLSQIFHYPDQRVFAYQYNVVDSAGSKHFIVWERYFEKEHISELLKEAGFREVEFYESVCPAVNDFAGGGEVFAVARK